MHVVCTVSWKPAAIREGTCSTQDKASRGHVALAEYRFTTAVAASIACCAVDVIGIVRGLYVLTLRALHACAVEVWSLSASPGAIF